VQLRQSNDSSDALYRQKQALKALDGLLQREYQHELNEYKVHKKITNLLCDMGFLISENPRSSNLTRYHRLVKKTERHMIVVTYRVRRRLIQKPS